MVDVKMLPTEKALSDFGLSRFVRKTDRNNNPFIKYSGEPKINTTEQRDHFLNEVILEVFENQPVKIETSPDAGGIMRAKMSFGGEKATQNIIDSYRILIPSQQINIAHQHKWGAGSSFLGDIYNKVNEVLDTGSIVLTSATNAAQLAPGGQSNFQSPVSHKTDFQQTYEKSNHPEVQLDFQLFTNNDFINDIYAPLMTLVSYTYPKRINSKDTPQTGGVLEQTINQAQTVAEKTAGELKEFVSISARQYSLRPPCLFNIYHQSGLYTYSNCFCTNVSVNYDGPWYNADGQDTSNFNIDVPQEYYLNGRTFPSTAKITMSFKSSELMFRDDFTLISKRFQQLVDSGESTTTFNQFTK